ncbi:MAG: hypothetical protein ACPGVD_03070 [Flavobacteriales bacterium]
MNRKKLYLIITLSVFFGFSYSQDEAEIKKIRFGLDLGVNLPNKQFSKFLNGNHPFGVTRILNNTIIRQQIETKLRYPIKSWEFSENTSYNPTIYAGLYTGFDFKPNWSAIMKVNVSVLRFSTPFVIALDNPQNFTGEFEQATVTAREQRFGFELGLQKTFDLEHNLSMYAAGGGSFNYIQLEKQELVIAGTNYNITRIQNPQSLVIQQIDGFGYGVFVETGISYLLNEKFTISFGVQGSLQSNKEYVEELTEGSTYRKDDIDKAMGYLPSFNSYFRLIWN